MGCGAISDECEVRIVEFEVWSVEFGVQSSTGRYFVEAL